jgi:hypothetical protein
MDDARRSRVRTLLGRVRAALETHDATHGPDPTKGLRESFADLVTALDLGDEPVTRDCPSCGSSCMEKAKICSNCWVKLPLAA